LHFVGRVVRQGFPSSPDGWDFPDPVIRAFAGYGTARPPVQMGMGANVLVHMHIKLALGRAHGHPPAGVPVHRIGPLLLGRLLQQEAAQVAVRSC